MRLSEATRGLEGRLVSDGEFESLAFATERNERSFLTFIEKEKFLPDLENPSARCVLATEALAGRIPAHVGGVFVCRRPKAALFSIHNALASREDYAGRLFPTVVGKDCRISPLAFIAPEGVVVGDRVEVGPFAVIKGRVRIGNDVVVHSGVVLGCAGFSFAKDAEGRNVSVRNTASIVVEDRAELFDKVMVSTGIFPWERTVIGMDTKLDTGVFVAHGSHIGKDCLFAANALVAGNCMVGDGVWIGPGAVVSNRISLGDGCRVSLGAVVTKDVGPGKTVSGNFAIPHARFLENLKASLAGEADPPACLGGCDATPYACKRCPVGGGAR